MSSRNPTTNPIGLKNSSLIGVEPVRSSGMLGARRRRVIAGRFRRTQALRRRPARTLVVAWSDYLNHRLQAGAAGVISRGRLVLTVHARTPRPCCLSGDDPRTKRGAVPSAVDGPPLQASDQGRALGP